MLVTMLVTFEISEESLSTRNDCKKFPKLSQTSFSRIVHFCFIFQSSSELPFVCTLTQPLIMSLQSGKVLHVEYLTTGWTSQCVFEAVCSFDENDPHTLVSDYHIAATVFLCISCAVLAFP